MILPVKYSKLSPTQKRMVREEYIEQQDGLCYYCKEDLSKSPPIRITKDWIYWKMFPVNFLKYPIHLHHCHDTDNTLGAVHAHCNAHLWQYKGE